MGWRADTTSGSYFVKVSTRETARLRDQYRIMAALSSAGAPTVAPILVSGEPYLRIGRDRYQIFPFIRGTKIGDRQQWSGAAGSTLAQLHVALDAVQLKCRRSIVAPMPDARRDLRRRVTEASRMVHSRLPLFTEDHQARVLGDRLLSLVDLWYSRVAFFRDSVMPKLSAQFIHGDFQPSNIISVTPSEFVVVDFDKLAFGPPVFDLAKLISCACFSGMKRPRFERSTAAALIASYDATRKLTSLERQSLPWLVVMNQFSGLWVIEEYFERGNALVGPLINEYVRRLAWLSDHADDLFTLTGGSVRRGTAQQQRLAI